MWTTTDQKAIDALIDKAAGLGGLGGLPAGLQMSIKRCFSTNININLLQKMNHYKKHKSIHKCQKMLEMPRIISINGMSANSHTCHRTGFGNEFGGHIRQNQAVKFANQELGQSVSFHGHGEITRGNFRRFGRFGHRFFGG